MALFLNENTRFGGETGAALMRNRCAFTTRDMSEDWASAFTYAIVFGWDSDEPQDIAEDPDFPGGAMREQADRWGWDHELISFLRDTHERFAALADRAASAEAD